MDRGGMDRGGMDRGGMDRGGMDRRRRSNSRDDSREAAKRRRRKQTAFVSVKAEKNKTATIAPLAPLSDHNATRKQRRLYIGNCPWQQGLTEEELNQTLFMALRKNAFI